MLALFQNLNNNPEELEAEEDVPSTSRGRHGRSFISYGVTTQQRITKLLVYKLLVFR